MAKEKSGADWAEGKRPNPHFFKVLVGDFTKFMKIPPKFHKHLQEEMESKPSSSKANPIFTAFLAGPTGRTCQVIIEKTKKGIFFTSGWSQFVADHSLNEHELLIFRYNGSMQFTVLIFDKTACEKYVCHENEYINKFFDERPIETDSSEDKSDEEDYDEAVHKKTSKSKSKCKKGNKRRCPVPTEKEKKDAQKVANSFVSQNPFFIIHLRPSHVYSSSWSKLRFPSEFSKKYLPKTKCEFVLRVSSCEKVWDMNYIPCVKERDRLCKGWSVFARENLLEADDFCAFELVKPTEFQVHIFRAVDHV